MSNTPDNPIRASDVEAALNGGGGGGGGSSAGYPGARGGAGVAILRYAGTTARATGGTIEYKGGYVYHTFTSDGTFSI